MNSIGGLFWIDRRPPRPVRKWIRKNVRGIDPTHPVHWTVSLYTYSDQEIDL